MLLCFVDESGSPDSPNQDEVFVLAGVVLPFQLWGNLDAEVEGIKRRYSLAGHELHTAELYSHYKELKELEQIPGFQQLPADKRPSTVIAHWNKLAKRQKLKPKTLKRMRKQRCHYIHLTRSECLGLLKEICDLMVRHKECSELSVICEAVEVKQFSSGPANGTAVQARDALTVFTFGQLLQTFQRQLDAKVSILARLSGSLSRKQVSGPGLIVHDNTNRASIIQLYSRLRAEGATQARLKHSIGPTPLFVDSKLTNMIQLADLAAVAVRKYLRTDDPILYDALEPAIEHASHFCGGRACDCRICARYA